MQQSWISRMEDMAEQVQQLDEQVRQLTRTVDRQGQQLSSLLNTLRWLGGAILAMTTTVLGVMTDHWVRIIFALT